MSKETKCCEECKWYQMNRCYLNGNCLCHKEPKESFEERTAKKLDNDILSKISEEPKEWEEWFDTYIIKFLQTEMAKEVVYDFISQVESKAYNKGFKDGEDYANDMEHSGKSNIIKP